MRLSLRGIGVPIVTRYLEDLGAVEIGPGLLAGQGWQVRVWQGEPFQLYAIRVGVTELEFSGEDSAVVDKVVADFKQKAIRAGG